MKQHRKEWWQTEDVTRCREDSCGSTCNGNVQLSFFAFLDTFFSLQMTIVSQILKEKNQNLHASLCPFSTYLIPLSLPLWILIALLHQLQHSFIDIIIVS